METWERREELIAVTGLTRQAGESRLRPVGGPDEPAGLGEDLLLSTQGIEVEPISVGASSDILVKNRVLPSAAMARSSLKPGRKALIFTFAGRAGIS